MLPFATPSRPQRVAARAIQMTLTKLRHLDELLKFSDVIRLTDVEVIWHPDDTMNLPKLIRMRYHLE